jgi:hypothetical protein
MNSSSFTSRHAGLPLEVVRRTFIPQGYREALPAFLGKIAAGFCSPAMLVSRTPKGRTAERLKSLAGPSIEPIETHALTDDGDQQAHILSSVR